MTRPWIRAFADWIVEQAAAPMPEETLHAARRATLDTVACALGALDDGPCASVLAVARALGGAAECSLVGQDDRTSPTNATLYNCSLIRALDANDIYFRNGGAGHPSDNLPVALALAERGHLDGLAYLRCVVVSYELYWRVRQRLFQLAQGYAWDHVSVSGIVAAGTAGVAMGLDADRLANAMAIGGAQVLTLGELHGGEISSMKAAGNAVTAQVGVLGALLAAEGMTGAAEILEGQRGLLAALGVPVAESILADLVEPVQRWRIHAVTVKPYPAIGTSQSAIAATLELVQRHGLRPEDVERVEVALPDLPFTRRQMADPARRAPGTRETADHSIPYLVAVALEDGDLGSAQFADGRWLAPRTRELMDRVALVPEMRLREFATDGFPAVVTATTRGGSTLTADMSAVPGSPRNPLTDAALGAKLRRLAGPRASTAGLDALEQRLLGLGAADDMAEVAGLLRAQPQAVA